ncbi:hypothetical protein HGP17_05715 [Rhizobium sp. P38BS-XIX]|uniref:hypothetical protein n=1 Tax=Rhizobium sp. P38BS-XIX TaxID=2726740 RepID=UPI001456C8E5|nr:hypothetical protein [Rhizobium sp. P38BS-XIX]NLR96325.1 hypothetical protein [Rhizobium sp. P38BS-XIX]
MTLSVGGRQLILVFGRRLEWSGPVARLAAIFVLFFRKLQLELRGKSLPFDPPAARLRDREI